MILTARANTFSMMKARKSPPSVGRMPRPHVAYRTPTTIPECAMKYWKKRQEGKPVSMAPGVITALAEPASPQK